MSTHEPRLILGICLLVLPIAAQSHQPLLPNRADLVGNLVPPADNASILVQPQATAPEGRTLYRWSVAAVLAGSVADAASAWKAQEANPVVAGTGNQFGAQSVAIKSGLVGTSLLIQHLVLRHRPDLYKRMAWLNLITSGALGGVAAYNVNVR